MVSHTLGAAWIHDIGMVKDRDEHGIFSASFLFEKNNSEFDFEGISLTDKIKIGLICIKHNKKWPYVYNNMTELLEMAG